MIKLGVLAGCLVLISGCAYRVALETRPSPAIVELPDGSRVTTPNVVTLRWAPFNRQIVKVTANGYRPMEVDLRRQEIRFGRFLGRGLRNPRGRVDFVLVPLHGAAGSWTEADIPE
jgi:hypothetical protein